LHTRSLKAGLDVSDPQLHAAWRGLVVGDREDNDGAGQEGVGWVLFGCVVLSVPAVWLAFDLIWL
jgi:hypothetical protein